MSQQKCKFILITLIAAGLCLALSVNHASAVPSFGRQTGRDCNSCHTIFPELTAFGRNFKMTGYTISKNSDKSYEWPPPISAHMIWSFTHTNTRLPQQVVELENKVNDNVNVPQELSLFWGGRILPYFGAFVQGTYDGVANKFVLDHTDIRPAFPTKMFNKDLVLGLTVNNAPTVQDVLNTTAFGFPWTSSATNLTPAAAVLLDGGLDSQVGGAGIYAFWNNLLYMEATVYRTARNGPTQFLGAGTVTDTLVDGAAPYWRVMLQHQWKQHSFAVGTFGLIARVFPPKPVDVPPNLLETRGVSDKFTDYAFDAQYQYLGKKHIFTAQTIFFTETQHFDRSFVLGNTQHHTNSLHTYKLNLNYYYRTDNWGTFGGTGAFFYTWGSADNVLFAPDPGGGSRVGRPDSNGFIIEATYNPFKYGKLSVQYTIFNKFNGAFSNYDGFGRKASDNNTLFLALWFAI